MKITYDLLSVRFPWVKDNGKISAKMLNELAGFNVLGEFEKQHDGMVNALDVIRKQFPDQRFSRHWFYFARDSHQEITIEIANWVLGQL